MTSRSNAPSRRAQAKAGTHARILASASRLIRHEGLAAASVVRVMRGARLTVGGFYAHFRSKRAMDAEALRATLADMRRTWFAGLEDSSGVDWLARAVKRYLAPAHRDDLTVGCPLPSVLSELAHADRGTRNAMAEELEEAARRFTEQSPESDDVSARERALATLALCVGGLALARALRDHPAGDELLRACVKWALPETRGRRIRKGDRP